MRLSGLRDKDVDALRRTFRHFSFVCEVRVFGSRARGIARRSSDLDLAISSPEATPTDWAELCDALENTPIIYELDIVRSEQVANKRLKDKIAREGVTIYPEIDEL
jgi:predicted nucleotidyltransferase